MSAIIKTIAANLAILAAWYAAEYAQFGELQHGRRGDDLAFVLYVILTAALFVRTEQLERRLYERDHPRYLLLKNPLMSKNYKKKE